MCWGVRSPAGPGGDDQRGRGGARSRRSETSACASSRSDSPTRIPPTCRAAAQLIYSGYPGLIYTYRRLPVIYTYEATARSPAPSRGGSGMTGSVPVTARLRPGYGPYHVPVAAQAPGTVPGTAVSRGGHGWLTRRSRGGHDGVTGRSRAGHGAVPAG